MVFMCTSVSLMCVTWLSFHGCVCDMTLISWMCVWHDSSHRYVWHDSYSLMCVCDMTCFQWCIWYECRIQISATGWRRSIGCLIFIGHFPRKSPVSGGSVAKNDLNVRHPMGLHHPLTNRIANDIRWQSNIIWLYLASDIRWQSYIHTTLYEYMDGLPSKNHSRFC